VICIVRSLQILRDTCPQVVLGRLISLLGLHCRSIGFASGPFPSRDTSLGFQEECATVGSLGRDGSNRPGSRIVAFAGYADYYSNMSNNRLFLIAICLVAPLTATLAVSMILQGGAPPQVPWQIADDGNWKTLYTNAAGSLKTVTVTNDGDDSSIKVRMKNQAGGLIGSVLLGSPDSYTATVSNGAYVQVQDPNDEDELDGSGNYQIQ